MTGRWGRFRRVGALIDGALPARVRHGLVGWRAVELWRSVAGPELAAHSAALSFRDGRLVVEVVNSVWMHQLSASRRGLRAALNAEIGSPIVEEIVFRINPTLAASGRPAPPPAGRRAADDR